MLARDPRELKDGGLLQKRIDPLEAMMHKTFQGLSSLLPLKE
jgi:hypothetical protein